MIILPLLRFLSCALFVSSSLFSWETSLLLVRHGETDWNVEKRSHGHTDIPLNAQGIAQAQAVADKMKELHPDLVAVYSSDLKRALSTANKTAEKLHLPVGVRPSLRELHLGSSEGMKGAEKLALYKEKWAELDKKFPNRSDRWDHTPVPGEETLNQLLSRVQNELLKISQAHPGKKVAVFSHGKVVQAFLAEIEDKNLLDFQVIPNCGIIEVVYDSENPQHPFRLVAIYD